MKYYSIEEFANRIGKTIQTFRNWNKKNILKPSHVTQGLTRYHSQEQLNHFLGLKSEIVTVFNYRFQGKLSNKAKKMTKELIDDDKDIENNADS